MKKWRHIPRPSVDYKNQIFSRFLPRPLLGVSAPGLREGNFILHPSYFILRLTCLYCLDEVIENQDFPGLIYGQFVFVRFFETQPCRGELI